MRHTSGSLPGAWPQKEHRVLKILSMIVVERRPVEANGLGRYKEAKRHDSAYVEDACNVGLEQHRMWYSIDRSGNKAVWRYSLPSCGDY